MVIFPADSGVEPVYVMLSSPLDSGIFTRKQLLRNIKVMPMTLASPAEMQITPPWRSSEIKFWNTLAHLQLLKKVFIIDIKDPRCFTILTLILWLFSKRMECFVRVVS
ncbi:hypothetical protein P4234_27165 [Pseudomonas aeruginosa]|nr:hypothetical protein [Pseudomonas aeruginosa]